ncbi:PhoX domain-containing protein [Hygrophoropsis aurantiaca]|uniref:PhoX domain-containing protein n=1 Tax=Hygrophoropsis aurantiaca TaxID=72124 RepID=A0ACB8ACK8_9AGAM|nr:PhoX domain-containing protein [Hygrophoropsis aurantiaca]
MMANDMYAFLCTYAAFIVAFLAVMLPFNHVFSSPMIFLLTSPIVLFVLAFTCFISYISLGQILDARQVSFKNNYSRAARPLAFSTPAAWQAVLTRSQWSQKLPQSLSPICPELPMVSSAVNDIMIFIVRDFVLSWYKDISASPTFPMAVSSVLRDTAEQLVLQTKSVDISSLVIKRILPKITTHIEQFRQSEIALRGAGLERRLTQSEELDMLLASRYAGKGGGKLHPAVENLSSTFTKPNEEMHMRGIVDRILPHILPEKESQSKALRIVVREILTCVILYPIMDMISDPDFWNRTIEDVAGAAIHQQKLISKVRNVLEAQSPRRHPRLASTDGSAETITIRTDIRQFESFLRSIGRCSSLLDARRLKNDITGEIRRTRLLLANHERDDWINGEKTEDIVAFLDRLYTAKRTAEQRIVVLGGQEDPNKSMSTDADTGSRVTLREVLRNPASLSYLMEFMDRRHRSLLVQFWLTVESFKNPLESIDSGSSGDEAESIRNPTNSTTLKEDLSMINDLYFSASPPHPSLSSVSKKHVDNIRSFAGKEVPLSSIEERKVRRSVLLAQRQIEQDMEQDFEDFQRSELWFRVVEDADFGNPLLSESMPNLMKTRSKSPPSISRPHILPTQLTRSESTPSMSASFGKNSSRVGTSSSENLQLSPPYASSSRSNIQVLMSPISDVSSDTSRAPLFDDPDDIRLAVDESERMEAIQAALTDIIATDQQAQQPRPNEEDRSVHFDNLSHKLPRKTQGVFGDEDEGNYDGEGEDEDEGDDRADSSVDAESGSFKIAGPGDLQLSYEITRLGGKISKLEAHDNMLDSLIKKAELTGDIQELRLLRKAKSSMARELRELQFQKIQYEQQESVNRLLSHRTKVSIASSTIGEEGGKSVVRYLVEIQQLATDGSFASGWVVARRYNEFLAMHNKLRDKYATVKSLDFPGKRLVAALSGSFVDTRKQALEKYTQSLIAIPAVCESGELRAFLSRDSPFMASDPPDERSKERAGFSGSKLVRSMYRSVADSIDDMFFGPSMLDVMIQRLTQQAAEFAGVVGSAVNDEDLVAQALKAFGKATSEDTLMQMSGMLRPLEGETSTSSFSAPICDLVLAVFELNKKNNWLRRQAIVIILQQVLGDTIERKIRHSIGALFEESRIMPVITMLRDALWPGGKLRPPSQPRTSEDKLRSRGEANRKLSALVPDLAANMIGRSNARRGARRLFAVLQNRRLNQHIAYTIVDEVVGALFPETPP